MKKFFSLLAGVLLTLSFSAKAANGDFDFTEQFGDGTVEYCGQITSWDGYGPHGTVTITVTDKDGNTLSWDATFSCNDVNTDSPLGNVEIAKYPEIATNLEAWASSQIR